MSLYAVATERRPRLMGVFAHPDDEVFCAGGLLARWAEAGGETMVVSATRGEAGQIQVAEAATRRTLGAVREGELRAACEALGVRQVECLDYGDGMLREVGEETLASEVAASIRAFAPDVVVTFGPDGGYGHPDHIAISAATTRACQQIAAEGGHAPQLYYSSFPRQHRLLCERLAHWVTTRRMPFRGSAAFVRALTLLADESTELKYIDDAVSLQWFPAGFSIVEQGEAGTRLYLIVSGHAEVVYEDENGTRYVRSSLEPGQFFGEEALAYHQAHASSVVATDTVTCLVLSAETPTLFAGRGAEAHLGGASLDGSVDDEAGRGQLIRMDVSANLDAKVAALAAHRTQFATDAAMFPDGPVWELMASEYFERVPFTAQVESPYADGLTVLLWQSARAMAVPA